MKQVKFLGYGLAVLLSLASLNIFGQGFDLVKATDRCSDDQLTTASAGAERNAWAVKCRLIKQSAADFYAEDGQYSVFTYNGATFKTPVDRNASCENINGTGVSSKQLASSGGCPIGCYAAKQNLLFSNTYKEIAKALSTESTVTSLSPDAQLNGLTYVEQKIGYFTKGESHGIMIDIIIENGKKLQVTPDHPVVNAEGKVVRADSIKKGMMLYTTDGVKEVVRIERYNSSEVVWNVRPVSDKKNANIHVADGFLVGSLRFQNEWANKNTRLENRTELNIEGI